MVPRFMSPVVCSHGWGRCRPWSSREGPPRVEGHGFAAAAASHVLLSLGRGAVQRVGLCQLFSDLFCLLASQRMFCIPMPD